MYDPEAPDDDISEVARLVSLFITSVDAEERDIIVHRALTTLKIPARAWNLLVKIEEEEMVNKLYSQETIHLEPERTQKEINLYTAIINYYL